MKIEIEIPDAWRAKLDSAALKDREQTPEKTDNQLREELVLDCIRKAMDEWWGIDLE